MSKSKLIDVVNRIVMASEWEQFANSMGTYETAVEAKKYSESLLREFEDSIALIEAEVAFCKKIIEQLIELGNDISNRVPVNILCDSRHNWDKTVAKYLKSKKNEDYEIALDDRYVA